MAQLGADSLSVIEPFLEGYVGSEYLSAQPTPEAIISLTPVKLITDL